MRVTEKIQITNEDNMELMARYPDNYFELAIVDPPYGIERFQQTNRDGKKETSVKLSASMLNEWDIKPDIMYFNDLFRVSKNQIIWGANNFNLPTTEYFCIWDKKQPMPNFARCEYAWVSMGLKKPAKIFEYSFFGGAKYSKEERFHPTQKPVKLYEWLLMNYAKEGDKIFDTHLGSGSIAIACHNLGFELTACELDEDYYKASIKRIKQHISQQRLF
jgi:site-specific DNA-methyltransferase (adenine-specific)